MELASIEFLPGFTLEINATKAPNFSPPTSLEIYAIETIPFLLLAQKKNRIHKCLVTQLGILRKHLHPR